MEHVIGDFFVVDGLVYQCREGDNCHGCSCFYEKGLACEDASNRYGECNRVLRKDKKDVYFVQVGEVDAPLVITSDMLKQ